MYRIIRVSDGRELGITDRPMYIKYEAGGCFTPAKSNEDAIGIALGGVPYNLLGHNEIEGAETVYACAIDSGVFAAQQQNILDVMMASMLEG